MAQGKRIQFVQNHSKREPLVSLLKEKVLHELSIKAIRRLIDQKKVMINQVPALKANQEVKQGDVVSVYLDLPESKPSIEVLYEDADLFILNKPSFVPSIESTICQLIGNKKYFLCHRLDKETSGVLILAKNQVAKKEMEKLFYDGKIKKRYLAIVKSRHVLPDKWMCQKSIGIETQKMNRIKMKIDPKGASAETFFQVVKAFHPDYWVACYPKTGRTHQIRLHLSSEGAPIIGDLVYGGDPSDCGRFLLHAESVVFTHPILNIEMTVQAPIPDAFKKR